MQLKDSKKIEWTLVTGGAKGLGAHICVRLARAGFPILVHYYQSQYDAQKIVEACSNEGVSAQLIYGDFSTLDSTQAFVSECLIRFPDIKNLINNVGSYLIKPLLDTSFQEWSAIFQTNLHVPFVLSQALVHTIRQYRGNIINIGVTGLSSQRVDIRRGAYKIAKGALLMMTKTLAKELSPDIRVNMISPGILENSVDLKEHLNVLPLGRPVSFEEVARVLLFLIDENSAYITGQNIEVSGGIGL